MKKHVLYMSILSILLVAPVEAWLQNTVTSYANKIAHRRLNTLLQKTYELPKFRFFSPKKVGAFVNWGTTIFLSITSLIQAKKIHNVTPTNSEPLDHQTAKIIKNETNINPDVFKTAEDAYDRTFKDRIHLSRSTIEKINNNDVYKRYEGLAISSHEYEHYKNGDILPNNIQSFTAFSFLSGIFLASGLGHIGKKVFMIGNKKIGYIKSIRNGLWAAYAKLQGAKLFYLYNVRTNIEGRADNIQHENPEIRYKLLDGMERALINIKSDPFTKYRKKGVSENTIKLLEFLSTHPDTKKRVKTIKKYKTELLQKHPRVAEKVADNSIWKD